MLVDGTWNQARSMVNHSPYLFGAQHTSPPGGSDDSATPHASAGAGQCGLRHVHLDTKQHGEYRWRKEPREFSLSTLEAVVCALDAMCGSQVRHWVHSWSQHALVAHAMD